ncbi:MAG TPA: SRPBCC domain-containing protein [Candidatus Saccharimonadales bacterium]|nr:SRPBCC domain-containing protein [Candidatus Saccharimonadales bacterium]
MKNEIVKEIIVKAKRDKVYNAIADPKQIINWFPDAVEEAGFEPGERPFLRFGDFKTRIYIEAAKPFEYFAYRWVPGGVAVTGDVLKQTNTLVEFFIDETTDGTKVTLKESGFAKLPAESAKAALDMMQDGWTGMMGKLENTLNQG